MKNNKILTVTPNPALDLGGVVKEIIPDEKNYVEEETRHPGGNAINSAPYDSRVGRRDELSADLKYLVKRAA